MFSLAIVIMAERSRELRCGPMPLEPLEGTRLYLSVAVSSHTPGMMGDLIPARAQTGPSPLTLPKQWAALIAYSMSQPPDLAPGVAP